MDSSLVVGDEVVEKLMGRSDVLDDVWLVDAEIRKALIRYTAAIQSRRDLIVPQSSRDELELKFMRDIAKEIAWASAFPIKEHNPIGLNGSDVMLMFPPIGNSRSISNDVLEVPALRVLPGAWSHYTLQLMMAFDNEDLAAKLSEQELPELCRIQGTDVYFVGEGNHRVLGRQWLGDETILARVKTLELEVDRYSIDENGDVKLDGKWSNPVKVPQSGIDLMVDLGIAASVRDFGNR